MKRLLFLISISFCLTVQSQNIYNVVAEDGSKKPTLFATPTTEEEYNYMSKGYGNALAQGADLKKGYSVNDKIEPTYSGKYNFKFIPFYRSDKSFVGIIVKAHSDNSNKDYWYCLPLKNEALFQNFCTSVSELDELMLNSFVNAYFSFTRENVVPNTSDIEYAYMSIGYKNHIADGSDFKKGYKIGETNKREFVIKGSLANYSFSFLPFMRDNGTCAGTIMKLVSDGSMSGGTYYYGVANTNGPLLDSFLKEKSSYGPRVLKAILQAYVKYTLDN